MSTRCQLQIIRESNNKSEMQTMYYHIDGYPREVIPIIQKAYMYKNNYKVSHWKLLDPLKVSTLICWADPLKFEPDKNELHGDISYLYQLYLTELQTDPSSEKNIIWKLKIFRPKFLDYYEDVSLKNMECIYEYENIEDFDEFNMDDLLNLINKHDSQFTKKDFIEKIKNSPKFRSLLKEELLK